MRDARLNPRGLIAGNWKMNGLAAALEEAAQVRDALGANDPDVMICPPATLLASLSLLAKGSLLMAGAQDCHAAPSGAHTGDISAEMIAGAGAAAVILGHSERRADHGETSAAVRAKALAARRAGLVAIVCVGETAGARDAGLTFDVAARQIADSLPDNATAANTIVAYEPVWAIGAGATPTLAAIGQVHAHIRDSLARRFGGDGAAMRILYGGSVNPGNARDILAIANVSGALVGGASLKAADFLAIIKACRA